MLTFCSLIWGHGNCGYIRVVYSVDSALIENAQALVPAEMENKLQKMEKNMETGARGFQGLISCDEGFRCRPGTYNEDPRKKLSF